jgi:transcription initiation factor TFIID subunit TAF12
MNLQHRRWQQQQQQQQQQQEEQAQELSLTQATKRTTTDSTIVAASSSSDESNKTPLCSNVLLSLPASPKRSSTSHFSSSKTPISKSQMKGEA